MQKWKGSSKLAVTGARAEDFLNRIAEIAPIYDVKMISAEKIIFRTDYKNVDHIFAFIDKTCYNIEEISSSGFLPFLHALRSRWGLAVGGALFLAALVCFSMFLWNVDIAADTDYDTGAVYETLQREGLLQRNRYSLDCNQIEKFIYLNFQDVSYVSCTLSGTELKIRLVPSLTYEASKSSDAILADADGIVSRILVKSGTAVVKKGDIVKQGDTLIVGEVEGKRVPALGEVYVTVTLSSETEIPATKVTYESTGRFTDRRVIDALFYQITVNNPEITYTNYTVEEFSYYPFHSSFLPVKINVTRYRELTAVYTPVDIEAEKNAYVLKAIEDTLGGNLSYEIEGEHVETVYENGVYRVQVLVRLLQKCGGY